MAALKVVCAWCGVVLADGDGDGPVSHGICPDCRPKLTEADNEA